VAEDHGTSRDDGQPLRIVEGGDIGVAETGCLNCDDDLSRGGHRVRLLHETKGLVGHGELPPAHSCPHFVD